MDVTYPPSPWDLHGQAVVSVFLVPTAGLDGPPPGMRLVTVAGRAIVAAAFVRYREPSVLQYEEVLTAVLVRRRVGPRRRSLGVWIDRIWVDSPTSRDGGRDLWAIPKELATFRVERRSAVADGIASAQWTRTPGWLSVLRSRVPVRLRLVQRRGGRTVVTPTSGRILAGPGRGTWGFGDSLGHLRGRRPLHTVVIDDFRLRFGR